MLIKGFNYRHLTQDLRVCAYFKRYYAKHRRPLSGMPQNTNYAVFFNIVQKAFDLPPPFLLYIL